MIGANADETGREVPLTFSEAQFQAYLASAIPNDAVRAQVAERYSSSIFGSARRAYIALTSDVKFICPSRTIARALAGAQSEPVYRHFFTEVPDAPTSAAYSAFHGLELLYVFGILDIRGYAPTAFERALSTGMQRYWGSLAANGVPVAAGAAAWTRHDPTRDNFLNLDSAALAMGEGVNRDRCDFWSTLSNRASACGTHSCRDAGSVYLCERSLGPQIIVQGVATPFTDAACSRARPCTTPVRQ